MLFTYLCLVHDSAPRLANLVLAFSIRMLRDACGVKGPSLLPGLKTYQPLPIAELKIPPIPGFGLKSHPIPTLEISILENSTPKKPYITLPLIQFPAASLPGRGSHPLVFFPIHLLCEVPCAV